MRSAPRAEGRRRHSADSLTAMLEPGRLEELWGWACEDAGPEAGDVKFIPVSNVGNPASRGRFLPRGSAPLDLQHAEPDDEDAAAITAQQAHPRVAVGLVGIPVEIEERAILGLMRHHLEYARVLHSLPAVYRFTNSVTHPVLSAIYGGAGPGSAMVYNAMPMMRSANDAAATLVTQKFGPVLGWLENPRWGSLFRIEHDPVELARLAAHTLVFTALWRDQFELTLRDSYADATTALRQLDPQAGTWWETLGADVTFVALGTSASVFKPDPAEIASAADPIIPWRALEGLIDRALRYGLDLLEC